MANHNYNWNEIEGSNIVDLLKDSQSEYGYGSTEGLEKFYRGLREIREVSKRLWTVTWGYLR